MRIADLQEDSEEEAYRLTFNRSYGEKNRAYQFRVYKISDHQLNEDKKYVAQIIYKCETMGTVMRMHRILSVTLSNQDGSGISLDPIATPEGLRDWTNTPHYLYSVNNARQYFDLMDRLGELFPNRAEAGYFLSEFNRSCSSRYRSSDHCSRHQYRETP